MCGEDTEAIIKLQALRIVLPVCMYVLRIHTLDSCLCRMLVLSNSLYKRDMDITDAGLVSLAGQRRPLGRSKKLCPMLTLLDATRLAVHGANHGIHIKKFMDLSWHVTTHCSCNIVAETHVTTQHQCSCLWWAWHDYDYQLAHMVLSFPEFPECGCITAAQHCCLAALHNCVHMLTYSYINESSRVMLA